MFNNNKLLNHLLSFPDDDTIICELLELIIHHENVVVDALKQSPIVDYTNADLVLTLAKICTILDYKLANKYTLPKWVYDKRFYYDYAIYVGKHLSDFDKVKCFLVAPKTFRDRNIYFDLKGLERY